MTRPHVAVLCVYQLHVLIMNISSRWKSFLVIFILSIFWLLYGQSVYHVSSIIFPPINERILIWTEFFGERVLHDHCDSNCRFTWDRDEFMGAKGVLFHFRDVSPNDLPMFKPKNQKWILYSWESPIFTYFSGLSHEQASRDPMMQEFLNQVDYTMSYRRDDDIFAPYGGVYKREQAVKVNFSQEQFGMKSKNVAWMVSNCQTASKRESFAAKLRHFIDVDVYGNCGSHITKDSEAAFHQLEKSYKFYLSFENAICPDYVTEKVFRVMQYDLIPVVLGGASYRDIFPANSFIDALEFESPRSLAEKLDEISKNKTLYESYFAWKSQYYVKAFELVSPKSLTEKLEEISENKTQYYESASFPEFCPMKMICEKVLSGERGSPQDLADDSRCFDWRMKLKKLV